MLSCGASFKGLSSYIQGYVIVKCAQQGKRLEVKVKDLTTEEFLPLQKGRLVTYG